MEQEKSLLITFCLLVLSCLASAQEADSVGVAKDSLARQETLRSVVVTASSGSRMNRVTNTEMIGAGQLVRAACCNLGESFTTNPSVDVSYSDAATGAKQIKLLGLSGTYVQMLTENVPNLRGAALPYSLGYIPGPWMQSIQVSKGASSVKNGYESITGQINIEFLKPQNQDGVHGNLYYDTEMKLEANADGNIHLTDRLSTSLLLHYEDRQRAHDMDHDGFMDMPKIRQWNFMDRWAYVSRGYISQLFLKMLCDERQSGQTHAREGLPLYGISVKADRYELQWKNAVITNEDKNASVALMLHGSLHDQQNTFGDRDFDIRQKNGYAQLMYETDLAEGHNLSVGGSVNYDYYDVRSSLSTPSSQNSPRETTAGLYAQYTYAPSERLTLMAGVRGDRSSLHGAFFTPRLHLKYAPAEWITLRASAGKGYRTPQPVPENIPLFASNREIWVEKNLKQEEAWNYGACVGLKLPLFGKTLELNAEYYYTHFLNQMVVNVRDFAVSQGARYGGEIRFENLDGRSYSHTFQVDATYPLVKGLSATAAWRINDARTTYDGRLRLRPFTSRYKGLLTLSYKTPLELWQFDVTAQFIGHGERYDGSRYPNYAQLQAQVTREFRRFSLYAGGENLTNYKQRNPIVSADNPWAPAFDATQIWGPISGAMGYIGVRFKFEKN